VLPPAELINDGSLQRPVAKQQQVMRQSMPNDGVGGMCVEKPRTTFIQ